MDLVKFYLLLFYTLFSLILSASFFSFVIKSANANQYDFDVVVDEGENFAFNVHNSAPEQGVDTYGYMYVSPSPAATFVSEHPSDQADKGTFSWANVHPIGDHLARFVICTEAGKQTTCNTEEDILNVHIHVNPNPIANAGSDQTVRHNQLVTLDGSRSTGNGLTYIWSQVGGGAVVLAGGSTPHPTFTAPRLQHDEMLSFQLVVRDNHLQQIPPRISITGGTGGVSSPSSVHIRVLASSALPYHSHVRQTSHAWNPVFIIIRGECLTA